MPNILTDFLIISPLLIIGLLFYTLFYKKSRNQDISAIRILLIIVVPFALILFWWLFLVYTDTSTMMLL